MVSTLPLVIPKKLDMLCLPLTMQIMRRYMSLLVMPIGMRVMLHNVFLVHRLPNLRTISDTLYSILKALYKNFPLSIFVAIIHYKTKSNSKLKIPHIPAKNFPLSIFVAIIHYKTKSNSKLKIPQDHPSAITW
jgi:hypothetical protein